MNKIKNITAFIFIFLTLFHTCFNTEERIFENSGGVNSYIEEEFALIPAARVTPIYNNLEEGGKQINYAYRYYFYKDNISCKIKVIRVILDQEVKGRQEERYFLTSHFATST